MANALDSMRRTVKELQTELLAAKPSPDSVRSGVDEIRRLWPNVAQAMVRAPDPQPFCDILESARITSARALKHLPETISAHSA
jgi:hypothetical protein